MWIVISSSDAYGTGRSLHYQVSAAFTIGIITRQGVVLCPEGDLTRVVRHRYHYDDAGNVIEELGQEKQDNTWVNHAKTVRRFDEQDNIIEQRFPVWQDETWTDARRMLMHYDARQHHIQSIRQTWSDSMWVNQLNYELDVDSSGHRRAELWQRWTGEEWEDFRRVRYEYEATTE